VTTQLLRRHHVITEKSSIIIIGTSQKFYTKYLNLPIYGVS